MKGPEGFLHGEDCESMGQVGFLVPLAEFLPAEAPQRAYLAALDQLPWQTRVTATATACSSSGRKTNRAIFTFSGHTATRGPWC